VSVENQFTEVKSGYGQISRVIRHSDQQVYRWLEGDYEGSLHLRTSKKTIT